MNKNTENTVGALISEGGSSESSPISLALSASPVGFERVEYTPPAAPGADWSSIYAGTCIDLPNQAGVVQQPVLMGDVLTLPRAAQLAVYLRADDVGELLISSAALSEAEVLQRLAETPVCRPGKPLPSDDIHLRYDLDEEKWQEADTGAASWRCLLDFLPLAAGTYHIYGVVTNVDFPGGNNTNNRKLFRYALMAKDEKAVVHYYGAPRRVCGSCGCGSSDDGDADFLPRAQAPGWVHDPCPSFVTFNPATAKAL